MQRQHLLLTGAFWAGQPPDTCLPWSWKTKPHPKGTSPSTDPCNPSRPPVTQGCGQDHWGNTARLAQISVRNWDSCTGDGDRQLPLPGGPRSPSTCEPKRHAPKLHILSSGLPFMLLCKLKKEPKDPVAFLGGPSDF